MKNIFLSKLYDNYKLVSEKNPIYVDGALRFVPGNGNSDSKIVFIGEAPGAEEEATGLPFQGRSGKLLRHYLSLYGFNRENSFITNVLKFRPPLNRKPTVKEIENNREFLNEELCILDPMIIVPVGSTALSFFYPNKVIKMTQLHGKMQEKSGKIIFPLFHPAYILRNYSLLPTFIQDINNLSIHYFRLLS